MIKPVSIRSFPKAILHVDGDGFFASCEQAMNPELRGKPIVTGSERGIASAMSAEAKALGVTRGMPVQKIRKQFPSVIIVPSNYEAYSLYARRMYEIVRRYTPEVEEYSIDECFADLTGMRRVHRMSYRQMMENVKHDLESELGMTFSLGLGPSKVLAKLGSNWNKPSGITVISGKNAHEFLGKTSVGDLWGVGSQTELFLKKFRIETAYQLATMTEAWATQNLSKPYRELIRELRGESVFRVDTEKVKAPKSISKTKTFTPASAERDFVFSQLSKNIENACIKARRHGLYSEHFSVYLKTEYFRFRAVEFSLSRSVNTPNVIVQKVREIFDKMFRDGEKYRASGVVMRELHEVSGQGDLFGESAEIEKLVPVFATVDDMRKKYGKHTLFLGSSFEANKGKTLNYRDARPAREKTLLKGENARMRVDIPWAGYVV